MFHDWRCHLSAAFNHLGFAHSDHAAIDICTIRKSRDCKNLATRSPKQTLISSQAIKQLSSLPASTKTELCLQTISSVYTSILYNHKKNYYFCGNNQAEIHLSSPFRPVIGDSSTAIPPGFALLFVYNTDSMYPACEYVFMMGLSQCCRVVSRYDFLGMRIPIM